MACLSYLRVTIAGVSDFGGEAYDSAGEPDVRQHVARLHSARRTTPGPAG
jgi:hypothetical protein